MCGAGNPPNHHRAFKTYFMHGDGSSSNHPQAHNSIPYAYMSVAYRTAGFVCEVLICVNYASYRELASFNSAVSYSCTFVSAHCTCQSSVHVIFLSYISVQILQNLDTSASLPDPKGQSQVSLRLCESRARRHCNTSPI